MPLTISMDLNFEVQHFGDTNWLVVSASNFSNLRLEIGTVYPPRAGESPLMGLLRAWGMLTPQGVNIFHPFIAKLFE